MDTITPATSPNILVNTPESLPKLTHRGKPDGQLTIASQLGQGTDVTSIVPLAIDILSKTTPGEKGAS